MATFSGLTLLEIGTVTLQMSSSGLSSITTGNINVTAAAASQLILLSRSAQQFHGRYDVLASSGGRRSVRQPGYGLYRHADRGPLAQLRDASLFGTQTATASAGIATFFPA